MIEMKLYKCSICGKVFNTKQECIECEKYHSTCRCQGGGKPAECCIYEVLGYGENERIHINFNIPAIVKSYSRDNSLGYIHYEKEIKIKYCPFCGRELEGADK